jgi:hypothetical protein
VRLELTSTGVAIRSLSRLATRAKRFEPRINANTRGSEKSRNLRQEAGAVTSLPPASFQADPRFIRRSSAASCLIWSGRRDSNSRSEFGRLACFQLHHSREGFLILDFRFLIFDWNGSGETTLRIFLRTPCTELIANLKSKMHFGAPDRT